MDPVEPRVPPPRVFAAIRGDAAGDPTPETYADLEEAYKHFNEHLFDGMLNTPVLLSIRARTTMGYFSKERFVVPDGRRAHEIALNPEEFAIHEPKTCLATLVRMMVLQRLAETGLLGREGYHNRHFAALMKKFGLPTRNVHDESLETGYTVVHRIEPGGPFDRVTDAFLAKFEESADTFRARWADRVLSMSTVELAHEEARSKGRSKSAIGKAEGQQVAAQGGAGEGGEAAGGGGTGLGGTGLGGTVAGAPPTAAAALAVTLKYAVEDVVVPTKRPTKIKYQCPVCGWAAWGQGGMALVCGVDAVVLQQMNLPRGEVQKPVKLHGAIKLRKEPEVAYWERKMRK